MNFDEFLNLHSSALKAVIKGRLTFHVEAVRLTKSRNEHTCMLIKSRRNKILVFSSIVIRSFCFLFEYYMHNQLFVKCP